MDFRGYAGVMTNIAAGIYIVFQVDQVNTHFAEVKSS